MKETDEALNDSSYKIIGAPMDLHRQLGAGLLESVYEESLCVELALRNIPYERQKVVNLEGKGHAIG